MRWTKLKKLVESRFAPSLSKRLSINSAAYGNCTCGHLWVSLDGKVVANYCTRAYYNRLAGASATNPMYEKHFVVYGEGSRQGAYKSLFSFVHELSHEAALKSEDGLIQALAIADARLGKRRLAHLRPENLSRLAAKLLEVREAARWSDSIPPNKSLNSTPPAVQAPSDAADGGAG